MSHPKLLNACVTGNLAEVKAALATKEDINRTDSQMKTALHLASQHGHEDIAQLLVLNGARVNAIDRRNQVPLHYASESGSDRIALLLLNTGAEVNAKDWLGRTPLHFACKKKKTKMVQLLIARGAFVDARDAQRSTPLHWASREGCRAIIGVLVRSGANVNNSNCFAYTPLHEACNQGHLETARMLIDCGAHLYAVTRSYATPLHLACSEGHLNIVKLLIEAGANVHVKDIQGRTPEQLARQRKHGVIFRFLRSMPVFSSPSPSISQAPVLQPPPAFRQKSWPTLLTDDNEFTCGFEGTIRVLDTIEEDPNEGEEEMADDTPYQPWCYSISPVIEENEENCLSPATEEPQTQSIALQHSAALRAHNEKLQDMADRLQTENILLRARNNQLVDLVITSQRSATANGGKSSSCTGQDRLFEFPQPTRRSASSNSGSSLRSSNQGSTFTSRSCSTSSEGSTTGDDSASPDNDYSSSKFSSPTSCAHVSNNKVAESALSSIATPNNCPSMPAVSLFLSPSDLETIIGTMEVPWKLPKASYDRLSSGFVPMRYRPSVLLARLDLGLNANVTLLQQLVGEAGGRTAREVVTCPFGRDLAAAMLAESPITQLQFQASLERNIARFAGNLRRWKHHAFRPMYSMKGQSMENPDERKILEYVTLHPSSKASPYRVLDKSLLQQDPPIRVQRVFHGVKSFDAAEGILSGGFAHLQTTDAGAIGAGCYFTPDLDYALGYAGGCYGGPKLPHSFRCLKLKPTIKYRIVLVCDIQYGNPYPVLNAASCRGKPLKSGHDAHVAVVDFSCSNASQAKPLTCLRQWKSTRKAAEIVLNDPSCVLVRGVLIFRA
eukprot:m.148931 g.148931  ORF g.148931 m.148931 type:complete len:838 (-) comp16148_c0_seq1:682-3195(-)